MAVPLVVKPFLPAAEPSSHSYLMPGIRYSLSENLKIFSINAAALDDAKLTSLG